jgi:hypothetical protein
MRFYRPREVPATNQGVYMRGSIVPAQRDLFASDPNLPSTTVLRNNEEVVKLLSHLLWEVACRFHDRQCGVEEVDREQD